MLGHKISVSKSKKIELISSIISKHNSMKLDINYKIKPGKPKIVLRLNMLLNNQCVK